MTDITFDTTYQVPIQAINFGGHLGHVEWLHILHEARVQFLYHYGYTEIDIQGTALVMRHMDITYCQQAHWGDLLYIHITLRQEKARLCFDYVVKKKSDAAVALKASMQMVAVDAMQHAIVKLPKLANLFASGRTIATD